MQPAESPTPPAEPRPPAVGPAEAEGTEQSRTAEVSTQDGGTTGNGKAAPQTEDHEASSRSLYVKCLWRSGAAWVMTAVALLLATHALFNALRADGTSVGTVERGLELPVGIWVLSLIGFAIYWCLRNPLLSRRKLHELAAAGPLRRGLVGLWIPAVTAALALAVVVPALRHDSAAAHTWRWAIYGLVVVLILATAAIAAHLADYACLAGELARKRPAKLREAVQELGTFAMERLHSVQSEGGDIDTRLPDQQVTSGLLKKLYESLDKRLDSLQDELDPWVRRHGNVALLFHPDYLPHMSSAYLQISQWRGLNIVPRRVQLLARHWSLKGLDSEYVIVHDVSDIRQGYPERPPMLLGETDQKDSEAASKWRLRSLKKRAIVNVAPNGANLGIAIEEERQFNI